MKEVCRLFYDERFEAENKEVEKYLSDRGIVCTRVPSFGLPEPQLVVGQNTFVGLRRIKLGIEAKLEKGEL